MKTRSYTLLLGIIFLVIGILGFIDPFVSPAEGAPDVAAEGSYGYLLGLFPVNWLHNLVHIAFGIWGLAAYRSYTGAKGYCKANAVIYAVLAVAGLIPGLNTMFGLVPLFGNDVWLHALIAIASAYFGFFAHEDATESNRYSSTAV
ncbi:MAG TPA: DUF4383 domain-containing protein [Alphaproteobacteria bacterium]|nr:DUF4383 domain-containing protein [Alphaproteobacteria bacterium]